MDCVRRAFDRAVCEKRLGKNQIVVTILSGFVTILCFILYANTVGPSMDIRYGAPVFFLLLFDLLADTWAKKKFNNEWMEMCRFDYKLQEVFRVIYLFVIPVLSVNQFLKSDMYPGFLPVILLVPLSYLMPTMRVYFDRNYMYSNALKMNLVLNMLISLRTTFYGILCASAVVSTWALRQGRSRRTGLTLMRSMAAYFAYVTLCRVAIPRCVPICPGPECCVMSPEQCRFFKTYYDYHKKKRVPEACQ